MCKKQPSVSHSSTESEIISLDTGLRLDGLPALELWDLIVSVLGNISRVSDRSGKPESDDHKHHVMKDSDAVPSNVQSACREALLYVFEDNDVGHFAHSPLPFLLSVSVSHLLSAVFSLLPFVSLHLDRTSHLIICPRSRGSRSHGTEKWCLVPTHLPSW